MKTILLPTDFSKNSINAIDFAMSYFQDQVCDFYILNVQKASSFVTDDMMTVSFSTSVYKTIVDASKKSIENVISMVKSTYNNKKHTFHSIVDYDNFIDSINQACSMHNIDLIVMGTQGASGISKFIFGSNTVRVMQRLQIPVLAIPEGCKFVKPNKVALITNNISKEEINKLDPLKDLLLGYDTTLTGLYLNSSLTEKERLINCNFLEALFKKVECEKLDLSEKDLFNKTDAYLKKNNIQILALLHEKHSFLERLLHTHPVEAFGFNSHMPLFVMDA